MSADSFPDLDQFYRCSREAGSWLSRSGEFEVLLTANLDHPSPEQYELARSFSRHLPVFRQQSLAAFHEFLKLRGAWSFDGLQVLNQNTIAMEFSNAEDLYGFWTTKFLHNGGGFVLTSFARRQT